MNRNPSIRVVETLEEQERLWVEGISVHVKARVFLTEDTECCPDFSCCDPKLLQPREVREAFHRATSKERNAMLGEFLDAFVKTIDANVHVAGRGPST